MQKTTFANIDIYDFFQFYIHSKSRFQGKKDNTSEKVVIDEKELDGLEINDI